MRKIHILYLVFIIVIAILFIPKLISCTKNNDEEAQRKLESINKNFDIFDIENNKDELDNLYIIKAHGEEIYLYDSNFNVIEKMNIDYSSLREYDKTLFINGIYIDNMEDVYSLVEDFSN